MYNNEDIRHFYLALNVIVKSSLLPLVKHKNLCYEILLFASAIDKDGRLPALSPALTTDKISYLPVLLNVF